MAEVRDLFIGGLDIRLGAAAAAVLCLLFLFISRADWKKIIPRCYQVALAIVGVLAILLGIACAVDFQCSICRIPPYFL